MVLSVSIANKRTLSEAVRYYGCVGDSKYQRNKGVCGNKGVNKVNKVNFAFSRKALFVA